VFTWFYEFCLANPRSKEDRTNQEPAPRSGAFSRSIVVHGGDQHSFAHLRSAAIADWSISR
jgi:hypothetical protein